ncbi:MAG: tyrosine-protein phosphatase [Sandaracinaceae bacterium]|nr:tyrosine-protein phosphatase [Sandaracinaceae bacterium]
MSTPNTLLDLNLRDLGGLTTQDGHVVRSGLVYRAGALSRLDPRTRAALDDLRLHTIVDLRTPYERERYGTSYTPAGARLVLLPMDSGDLTKTLVPAIKGGRFDQVPLDVLSQINRALVRGAYPQLSVFLRLLATPSRRPLLFHCSHGKDRTGLAAALLLSALGVSWSTVLADYLRSNDTPHAHNVAFRRRLHRMAPWLTRRPWETPNVAPLVRLLSVDAEFLGAALDEMQSSHAGVDGYLGERLGVHPALRETLRSALLTSAA